MRTSLFVHCCWKPFSNCSARVHSQARARCSRREWGSYYSRTMKQVKSKCKQVGMVKHCYRDTSVKHFIMLKDVGMVVPKIKETRL